MLTPFKKMQGISLIEVMVAVVIFGLLLALGAGSFATWIQNQQTRTAAESILNGMQVARGDAVRRNSRTIFVLCDVAAGKTGSSWDVLAASATASSVACGPDSGAATDWVRVQQRPSQEGSRNVTASSAGNANTVVFDGFGRTVRMPVDLTTMPPAANPIVPQITQVDLKALKGDRTLSVQVTAGGSVRMCDPSPTLAANDPRHC